MMKMICVKVVLNGKCLCQVYDLIEMVIMFVFPVTSYIVVLI